MTEDEADIDVIESHLSDRAAEYAANYIGEDVQMGAMAVPPIPRDRVKEVVEDYDGCPDETFNNPLAGHLYDLTDLSLAINHAGDPMLDGSVEEDEEPYNVERDSVAEIKIARGALFSSFNRELAACARRIGLDPDEHEDLVNAIRAELDYEVDVSVDEDWDTADSVNPEDEPQASDQGSSEAEELDEALDDE